MTLIEYKAYLKGKQDALEELKKSLLDDCNIGLDKRYKKISKAVCERCHLWNTKNKEFLSYVKLKGRVSMYHYIDDIINSQISVTKYLAKDINSK